MLTLENALDIAGPAGKLATLYLPAQGRERGVAVINHPNPRQGGTNTNKVIQTAAKALNQLGFHCYLPNLRGVGSSEGEHDYGRGETDDCIAVIDYARAQHPGAAQFVLGGFSFGGYVSLIAAQARRPDLLLPVPLGRKRLRQRGFNQAQMLAEWLERALQLPVQNHWLLRLHEGAHQQELDAAARRRNLRQAGRAGVGTFLGLLFGAAAKAALALAMVGAFAAAYLV